MRRAVCLLRSRRRTFLLELGWFFIYLGLYIFKPRTLGQKIAHPRVETL